MKAKSSRPLVSHRVLPIIVGFGYFLFGVVTLSRQYTFDAISYLWDVEQTRLSIPLHSELISYNFFHSQHLLFSPSVYIFYHLWLLFGYHGSALLPAQVLNLVEGSVTLATVFVLLQYLTSDHRLSLLFSLFLGFTYAFWSNTAMVSDHMASCLLATVLFSGLIKTDFSTATRGRFLFLGFINGFAMLMHQVNGLLGVMFLSALFSEKLSYRVRMRAAFVYTTTATLTVLIPYMIVGVAILGNYTLYDFVFWCFYYAMPGVIDIAGRYGTFTFSKLIDLIMSFGASVIGGFYWINRVFEVRWLQRTIVPLLSALSGITAFYVVITAWRLTQHTGSQPLHRKALRLSLTWFTSYVLLLFWWGPTYYQLWAVPLIALAISLAISLHQKVQSSIVQAPSMQRGCVALILLVFTANNIAAYVPSHDVDNNDYYVTTVAIGTSTASGDLIVVPGNDEYETYIPYFTKRNVVSLHATLIDHTNSLNESLEEIHDKMGKTISNGCNVYIFSELYDSAITYADVYELHHLRNEDVASFFRQFTIADTVDANSVVLYKLNVKPNEPDNK